MFPVIFEIAGNIKQVQTLINKSNYNKPRHLKLVVSYEI